MKFRARFRFPRVPARATMIAAGMAVLVTSATVGYSLAAFSDTTSNAGNSFSAAPAFCSSPGTQTLLSDADAHVEEASPLVNFGAASQLEVRSQKNAKNKRTLVHFPLPLAPACTVTSATLRLWTNTGDAGRTLQAYVADTVWTEGNVTWATQPLTTGAPSTTTSAVGWIQFDVTVQTQNLLFTVLNSGFLIKDSVESENRAMSQQLHSRESGGYIPELVVTLG